MSITLFADDAPRAPIVFDQPLYELAANCREFAKLNVFNQVFLGISGATVSGTNQLLSTMVNGSAQNWTRGSKIVVQYGAHSNDQYRAKLQPYIYSTYGWECALPAITTNHIHFSAETVAYEGGVSPYVRTHPTQRYFQLIVPETGSYNIKFYGTKIDAGNCTLASIFTTYFCF